MRTAFAEPMQRLLTSLSALVPFPVAEWFTLCLLILLGGLVFRLCRSRRRRDALRLLAFTLSLFLLFSALWFPLTRTAKLPAPTAHTPEALIDLAQALADKANALSASLPESPAYEKAEIARRAGALMGVPVKPVMASGLMKVLNAAGLYFPFTGEALISLREPFWTLPFVACHEAAHALGYGREDEANAVAYRACLSGDAHFQYAGTVFALHYALSALRASDFIGHALVLRQLSPGVRRDLTALPARETHSGQSTVAEVFLRMGGQAGKISYDGMIGHLLTQRAQAGEDGKPEGSSEPDPFSASVA